MTGQAAGHPQTGWSIEKMVPDRDLDEIVELERESFVNPWTREMFRWELENSDVSHIYVLRIDGNGLAAFCSCWLIFDELHINNVAVRTEWRGRGMATALLEHVFAEAGRLGARRATLEVRRSNATARRLYERLGFTVAGTRKEYYRNPVEDALILWRDDLSRP
jgi:ribosomal-protein-alanine N-acetyltransferase